MASTVTETIQSVQYVKNCHVVEENGQIAQVFVEAELPEGTKTSEPEPSRVWSAPLSAR